MEDPFQELLGFIRDLRLVVTAHDETYFPLSVLSRRYREPIVDTANEFVEGVFDDAKIRMLRLMWNANNSMWEVGFWVKPSKKVKVPPGVSMTKLTSGYDEKHGEAYEFMFHLTETDQISQLILDVSPHIMTSLFRKIHWRAQLRPAIMDAAQGQLPGLAPAQRIAFIKALDKVYPHVLDAKVCVQCFEETCKH